MTYHEMWHQLVPLYGEGEAKAMARMVYEVRFGLTLADLLLGKDTQLSADCQAQTEEIACRLLRQEPIQYVLGQAAFCGRWFHVEPGVLIPRPETEELVRWMIDQENQPHHLLDIGTGSGCIAITLAQELPEAEVTAWDISETALRIAQENADRLGVKVKFERQDILQQTSDIKHQTSPTPQHP